jgi:RNA polymerase sigma-70 factor (ECF subfamily)
VAEADRILAALPSNYGTILRLRFLDGLTLKEAAAQMAVTVSNAKVLQHRALKAAARIAERSEA